MASFRTSFRARERYADRDEAGRVLAGLLTERSTLGAELLVLGLPRGGVPVAARVARELGARLDVLVVRKLGLPGRPELAMGAIAGVGEAVEVVANDRLPAQFAVRAEAYEQVLQRELVELRRREATYRDGPAASIRGRTVIVVDDGLATGSTMRAAIAAVRRQEPAAVIVAVPVGSAVTCGELRALADEVVCAWTPTHYRAVGEAYQDFSPTSDEQVREALRWAQGGSAAGEAPPEASA